MEHFLAIGEILKEKRHQIICLFPEQFRNLAEEAGFQFASLGDEFIKMLDSPAGKTAMGGGRFGFRKLIAYIKLISMQSAVNREMILKQELVIEREQPDRIVHNGKVIYPVIWSLANKEKTILLSPVPYIHYVKNHSHVAFNKNFGPFINKITYQLANFGLVKTIMSSVKWIPTTKKVSQSIFTYSIHSATKKTSSNC